MLVHILSKMQTTSANEAQNTKYGTKNKTIKTSATPSSRSCCIWLREAMPDEQDKEEENSKGDETRRDEKENGAQETRRPVNRQGKRNKTRQEKGRGSRETRIETVETSQERH